jgi:hypothetical protein
MASNVSKGVMEGLSNKTGYIQNSGIKSTDIRMAAWADQSVQKTAELIKSGASQTQATEALNATMLKIFPELKGALEQTQISNKEEYKKMTLQSILNHRIVGQDTAMQVGSASKMYEAQNYLSTHDEKGNIIDNSGTTPMDFKKIEEQLKKSANGKGYNGLPSLQQMLDNSKNWNAPVDSADFLKTSIPGGQLEKIFDKKGVSQNDAKTILGPKLDSQVAAVNTSNTLMDMTHKNNFTKLNDVTAATQTLHSQGYNALVEQQQTTNGLLELLISTTEKGKDINIDGKTVIAVTDRLRTKNYGLNSKSNNKGFSPTYLSLG